MSNFPDRPETPDFYELSLAVIDNDTECKDGSTMEEVAGQWIDIEALSYMAFNRVKRFDLPPIAAAPWLDGFATAMRMVENRAKQATSLDLPLDDR